MRKHILQIAILYVVLITALSLINLSGGEPLQDSMGDVTIVDKIIHLFLYFVFNFLMLMLFAAKFSVTRLPTMLLVSLGVVAFGVGIEFLQPYVGRECSLYDGIANALGVVIALIVFRLPAVSRKIMGVRF
ncbi:MAG: VanZ family protein [Rikenellaceae bacterium]